MGQQGIPTAVVPHDPGLLLGWLRRAIQIISRIIQFGAGVQNPVREDLIVKLQGICSRCEKAYSQLLKKLRPVKDAYYDYKLLPGELKKFSIDSDLAKYFKPKKLCRDVDQLLDDLNNYLKPLKYSIDVAKVDNLRQQFINFVNYDIEINRSFQYVLLGPGAPRRRPRQSEGQQGQLCEARGLRSPRHRGLRRGIDPDDRCRS
jgi:hypothetical protein